MQLILKARISFGIGFRRHFKRKVMNKKNGEMMLYSFYECNIVNYLKIYF